MVVASRHSRSSSVRFEFERRVQRLHRHHQRRRAAGEVEGLLVVGHRDQFGLADGESAVFRSAARPCGLRNNPALP